ncbi:MAG: hypothetical protein WDW38_006494 [Sanguina aurantia]
MQHRAHARHRAARAPHAPSRRSPGASALRGADRRPRARRRARQGNRVVPTHKARSVMAQVQLHLRGLQATTQMHATFQAEALDMTFTVGFRDVLESISTRRSLGGGARTQRRQH